MARAAKLSKDFPTTCTGGGKPRILRCYLCKKVLPAAVSSPNATSSEGLVVYLCEECFSPTWEDYLPYSIYRPRPNRGNGKGQA